MGGGRTGLLYEVLKELRDRRGFHAADDFIFEVSHMAYGMSEAGGLMGGDQDRRVSQIRMVDV